MKNLSVLCLLCLPLFVAGCVGPRYVVIPQQPAMAAPTGTNAPAQSVVYVAPQQIMAQPPLVYTSYPEYYPRYYYPPVISLGWSWAPRYYRGNYGGYHREYRGNYGGNYGGYHREYRGGSHQYNRGGHRR